MNRHHQRGEIETPEEAVARHVFQCAHVDYCGGWNCPACDGPSLSPANRCSTRPPESCLGCLVDPADPYDDTEPWPSPDEWQCGYTDDEGHRCVFSFFHTVDHLPKTIEPTRG